MKLTSRSPSQPGDNPAFDDAYANFLQSLPEQERKLYAPCATADDFLAGLQKLSVLSGKSRQKSRGPISSLRKLHDRLKPYFEVIQVFVSAKPEYAAIVWGALRLLLQLASNFASFFEKLISILERLADGFPQFADIARLCATQFSSSPSSQRMKSFLEKIYTDLFLFFQGVAGVFMGKNGERRSKASIYGTILWKPFESRFQDLLDDIKHHEKLIETEFVILQAQESNDERRAASYERHLAAEERKRAEERRGMDKLLLDEAESTRRQVEEDSRRNAVSRILKWLSPPPFAETLHQSQDLREETTNDWIFDDPVFDHWRRSSGHLGSIDKSMKFEDNVLWVSGNPGCGKTVLASSIVEELECEDDSTVVYYFFRYDDLLQRLPAAAFRSLLAQILHKFSDNEDIIDKFDFARQASQGSPAATTQRLIELLQICLYFLDNAYLILDGIDECDDNENLVRYLRRALHPSTKLLLCGRPNIPSLSRTIPEKFQLEVGRDSVNNDIRVYLTTQVNCMVEEGFLSPFEDSLPLIDHLLRGADGMFLWAKLMITYLRLPFLVTSNERVRAIKSITMPEGLETMYKRIVDLINGAGQTQRDLAKGVLLWVTCSKGPLLAWGIYEALHGNPAPYEDDTVQEFEAWSKAVVVACSGLIETQRIPSPEIGQEVSSLKFQFTHLSIREYLEYSHQPPQTQNHEGILIPLKPIANIKLATQCVKFLLGVAPKEVPIPNSTAHNSRMMSMVRGFADHAAAYWFVYFQQTLSETHMTNVVNLANFESEASALVALSQNFLMNRLAISSWIEIYYFRRDLRLALDLRPIEDWLVDVKAMTVRIPSLVIFQELFQILEEFVNEIDMFIESWDLRLTSSPSLVWEEGSAFSNTRFLAQSSTTSVSYMVPERLSNQNTSSKPLCTVSRMSDDGETNGVLSVWPSEQYESQWQTLDSHSSHSSLQHLCKGWFAQYEVFEIESGTDRRAYVRLALSESEVWLQMRQSFRQECTDSWKTSFPLAISDNLLSFVVLRTLYDLEPRQELSSTQCRSCIIPLDFSSSLLEKWSDDLEVFNPQDKIVKNMPPALQLIHRRPYKYSFQFSPNGKSLFFSDYVAEDPFQTNLAVFGVHRGDGLRISAIQSGSMSIRGCTMLEKIAFHPKLDLIAMIDNTYLMLWSFNNSIAEMVRVPLQDEKSNPYKGRWKEVTFSTCGKYVIATAGGGPSVIPLPDSMLDNAIMSGESNNSSMEPEDRDQQLTKLQGLDVAEFGLRAGQVLHSRQVASVRDGQSASLLNVTRDGSVRVNLEGSDSLAPLQSLSIVDLPTNLPGLQYTSPAVKMPKSSKDPVRVVLNKSSQNDYSMKDSPEEKLPLVVDRSIGSIKHTVSIRKHAGYIYNGTGGAEEEAKPIGTSPALNKAMNLGKDERTRAFDGLAGSESGRVGSEYDRDAKRIRL